MESYQILKKNLIESKMSWWLEETELELKQIQSIVSEIYPNLCDSDIVRTNNGEAEWKHYTRLSLESLKKKGIVKKVNPTKRDDLWVKNKNISINYLKITSSFINEYYDLPSYGRNTFNSRQYKLFKKEWYLSKKDIASYINKGSSGIDFLWQAIIFSLFSKIVYYYHKKNYKYCSDFIGWSFYEYYSQYPIQCIPIFKGKFKNFVDEYLLTVLNKNKKNKYISDHSLINMNSYCAFLFFIFELMNKDCCEFNIEEVISEIKDYDEFKDEFSDNPNSMSYIFKNTLLNFK